MMLNLCYTYAVIVMWLDEFGLRCFSCYAILEGYLRLISKLKMYSFESLLEGIYRD